MLLDIFGHEGRAMEGQWYSIIDYARIKNISISTIRRYIKANRVKHKLVDGKYLLFLSGEQYKGPADNQELIKIQLENERLKMRIQKLESELNDLSMLVNIYEEKSDELPEIPTNL